MLLITKVLFYLLVCKDCEPFEIGRCQASLENEKGCQIPMNAVETKNHWELRQRGTTRKAQPEQDHRWIYLEFDVVTQCGPEQ